MSSFDKNRGTDRMLIVPPRLIITLAKLFIDNLQREGRRIRQQLLIRPAYLTDNKVEIRRVMAMKKVQADFEGNEKLDKKIHKIATEIMYERKMPVSTFIHTEIPESIYPEIMRRMNDTGAFNQLLTDEGLQKRDDLRGRQSSIREEREKKKADLFRRQRETEARQVSGSDFGSSGDDSGSGGAFSNGTGTLLQIQDRVNQFDYAPVPSQLSVAKPTKKLVKSMQKSLAKPFVKKTKSGFKKKKLSKNNTGTSALNDLLGSAAVPSMIPGPGSAAVPSMIPGPGSASGSATDIAPGGYASGNSSGSVTDVAPVSLLPDNRTVSEIMAERDRMEVLTNTSGQSSGSDTDIGPSVNMSLGRLEFEKNIDYLVRLRRIQRIKLADKNNFSIADTLQIAATIIKTQKAISRNKLAVAKRQKDLDDKRNLLEEQKKQLVEMGDQARLDRLSKSEEQKLRAEQIAEDQKIRTIDIAEEATRQREKIRTDVFALMSQNAELRTIAENVRVRLKTNPEYKNIDVSDAKNKYLLPSISGISASELKTLISTIPAEYQATLDPVVRSLAAGGNLDANTIVAGIVGIGLAIATGAPLVGQIGTNMFNVMRTTIGFDFNDLFQPELPPSQGVDSKLEDDTSVDIPRESKHNAVLDLTFDQDDEQVFEFDPNKIPYSDASELPGSDVKELSSADEKKGFNILLGDVASQLRAMLPNIPDRKIMDRAMNYLLSKTPTQLKRLTALALVVTTGTLRAIERQTSGPFKSSIKYMTGMDDEDARIIIRDVGIVRNALMSDVRRVGRRAIPRSVPSLVAPRRSDIDLGIGTGTTAAVTAAGLSRGSAMGAVSSVIPAMAGGAVAGGLSATALRTYFRSQGIPDSQQLDKKISYLSMLPIAAVGAYLGYTPSGRTGDVIGTGVTSGSGITEKKIMVDANVLADTQAKEAQDTGKNRQWAPKQIAPSPAIFDEPLQEKYAEDLETTLFDYVVPTSEGADGTILTNKLKANQYMNTQLRYTNAGVFVPRELWGQLTNTTPDTVKKLSLGQAPIIPLPQLEFMTQDFEDTWDNVARFQYVNKENTSIGLLDPYGDFSDVTNYLTVTPDSVLFTENP